MMDNLVDLYGIKCARLLSLLQTDKFRDLIPPIYPIDCKDTSLFFSSQGENGIINYDTLTNRFADYYKQRNPDVILEVKKKIGELPWIIRSSGKEDTIDNADAGRYESLVCDSEDSFFINLAKVMCSGLTVKSSRQGNLYPNASDNCNIIIPAFIQPLIQVSGKSNISIRETEVPFIDAEAVLFFKERITGLHTYFNLDKLDCEWVLQSAEGLISVTSISEINAEGSIDGQIAFGFDLFSTQLVRKNENSMLYFLPGNRMELWQGKAFREATIYRYWLVQARPATNYRMTVDKRVLSSGTLRTLANDKRWYRTRASDTIINGTVLKAGKFIKSGTLNQAWSTYINISPDLREEISSVFVENGTRTEHAGIMFGQTGIPVIKIDLNKIPAYSTVAIIDSIHLDCYFSTDITLSETTVKTGVQKMLLIPYNTSLVYTERDYETVTSKFLLYTKKLKVNYPEIQKLIGSEIGIKISDSLKKRIIQKSIYPSFDFLFIGTKNTYSPTVIHHLVRYFLQKDLPEKDILRALKPLPEKTVYYIYALLIIHGAGNSKRFLPRLVSLNKLLIDTFISFHDVEIMWRIIMLEKSRIPDSTINTLCRKMTVFINEKYNKKVLLSIINSALNFADSIRQLCIFSKDEKDVMFESYRSIIENIHTEEDIDFINILVSDRLLSSYYILNLQHTFMNNKRFLNLFRSLKEQITDFTMILSNFSVMKSSYGLNCVYMELHSLLSSNPETINMLNSIFNEVVELYDHTAKELLEILTHYFDKRILKSYLELLSLWFDFIVHHTEKKDVVQTFKQWLDIHIKNLDPFDNFFLKEIHWKVYVYKARLNNPAEIGIDNPHQIHNVLHQWSLALAPSISINKLPREIQYLMRFSNTFSEQDNRLLRFQRDLFEIELSMCTHKAGFIFTKKTIYVEFSEPPETKDKEIARLVVLNEMLVKISNWFHFCNFTHHYEKVAGSWTIFIIAIPEKHTFFTRKDYRIIFHAMRFLFDSTYDFSHTPVANLINVKQKFKRKEWKEIFFYMIQYRKYFDDFNQHVDLKVYVLSKILTELYIYHGIEKKLLNYYLIGFEKCAETIIKNEKKFTLSIDIDDWIKNYITVGHISLIMAAIWPLETLEFVAELKSYVFICNVICRNLFIRSDIKKVLKEKIALLEKDEFMKTLILHYAPDIIINERNVEHISEYLVKNPKKYKYAKQFTLHKYPSCINVDTRINLADDLDCLPFAYNEEQELALTVIKKKMKRFKINNIVPYIEYQYLK